MLAICCSVGFTALFMVMQRDQFDGVFKRFTPAGRPFQCVLVLCFSGKQEGDEARRTLDEVWQRFQGVFAARCLSWCGFVQFRAVLYHRKQSTTAGCRNLNAVWWRFHNSGRCGGVGVGVDAVRYCCDKQGVDGSFFHKSSEAYRFFFYSINFQLNKNFLDIDERLEGSKNVMTVGYGGTARCRTPFGNDPTAVARQTKTQ